MGMELEFTTKAGLYHSALQHLHSLLIPKPCHLKIHPTSTSIRHPTCLINGKEGVAGREKGNRG